MHNHTIYSSLIMRHPLLITATCATLSTTVQAQSTSDCEGATQLCGATYTESTAPPGTGNVYEFTGTCNFGLETMSLWYTFSVQETGNLSFVLDPANDLDDYDWGLFDITNGGCAGIVSQDGSSPEVNCNSYGSFGANGPTGISSTNGGTGASNGPGDQNGPPFNADLPVQAGEVYALVVMNWSNSQNGYSIDFSQSTAYIYDQDTTPEIASVEPLCGNTSFYVTFSEDMLTSSVQPQDFVIISPSQDVFPVISVTPDDALANAQVGFTIALGNSLLEGGVHTISVTNVAGEVLDVCGNDLGENTFQVSLEPPLAYDLEITGSCNGGGGTLQATYISGALAPVEFALDGELLANGSASGLEVGPHTLVITDAAGCVVEQDIEIQAFSLAVTIPEQDSLYCTEPSLFIEGVQVAPEGPVQFTWTANTTAGTDSSFSSIVSPEVSVPGTYVVQVIDTTTGCTASASVLIEAASSLDLDLVDLIFPNVVSPNGDGENDVWRPFLPDRRGSDLIQIFTVYDLSVFDRWGLPVFQSDGRGQRSWVPLDATAGTYYFHITLQADCGERSERTETGVITVLR
jgi:CHU_C Type IX secretion signal domain